MRTDTEQKILELCEQAKAKGWVFTKMNLSEAAPTGCGCALQACAYQLECCGPGVNWVLASATLGLHSALMYGAGFDAAADGEEAFMGQPEHLLGYKHGRHFVHGDPI